VAGNVIREDDVFESKQRVVRRNGFAFEYIQPGGCETARTESGSERHFVHERATGCINQYRSSLHGRQTLSVDHVSSRRSGRSVQRHDVRLLQQCSQIRDKFHTQLACPRGTQTRVKRQHPHPHSPHDLSDEATNPAGSNQPQHARIQLKPLLRTAAVLPAIGTSPDVSPTDGLRRGENQAHRMLRR
jgi:hypothetical protein